MTNCRLLIGAVAIRFIFSAQALASNSPEQLLEALDLDLGSVSAITTGDSSPDMFAVRDDLGPFLPCSPASFALLSTDRSQRPP